MKAVQMSYRQFGFLKELIESHNGTVPRDQLSDMNQTTLISMLVARGYAAIHGDRMLVTNRGHESYQQFVNSSIPMRKRSGQPLSRTVSDFLKNSLRRRLQSRKKAA
jgi:hypothetical protein